MVAGDDPEPPSLPKVVDDEHEHINGSGPQNGDAVPEATKGTNGTTPDQTPDDDLLMKKEPQVISNRSDHSHFSDEKSNNVKVGFEVTSRGQRKLRMDDGGQHARVQ